MASEHHTKLGHTIRCAFPVNVAVMHGSHPARPPIHKQKKGSRCAMSCRDHARNAPLIEFPRCRQFDRVSVLS
jgi:hypothetical protein